MIVIENNKYMLTITHFPIEYLAHYSCWKAGQFSRMLDKSQGSSERVEKADWCPLFPNDRQRYRLAKSEWMKPDQIQKTGAGTSQL